MDNDSDGDVSGGDSRTTNKDIDPNPERTSLLAWSNSLGSSGPPMDVELDTRQEKEK